MLISAGPEHARPGSSSENKNVMDWGGENAARDYDSCAARGKRRKAHTDADQGAAEADGGGLSDSFEDEGRDEWRGAQYGGQGGHEYGADSIVSAANDGVEAVQALFAQIVDVVDDDNSVVDDDAHHENAAYK